MNGWLIYEKESLERNAAFADMLTNEARANNIDIALKLREEINFSILPQFVIQRTYDFALSKKLEELGVKVFNNSKVSYICNDKYNTYEFFKDKSIPMMETVLINTFSEMPFPFPFVIKPCGGHGGEGVYLVNSKEEYSNALSTLKGKKIIAQMPATDKGKDLRVYVMGNKIIKGMLRVSESDFRSNFSLGGKAYTYELNKEEKDIIKKVTAALSFDFAGIDLIYHNGKPILNEIEDVVGSRMLYKYTNIDVCKEYITYIKNCLADC